MSSLLALELAFTVVVLGEGFLRTDDADQAGVLAGEGQALGIPEQDLVGFVVALFAKSRILGGR